MVVTTINPLYKADEIAKQLVVSKTKILVGLVAGHAILQDAINKSELPIRLVCIKLSPDESMPQGAIDFKELIDTQGISLKMLVDPKIKPNELAVMPFSSGTTGLPKGVCLSHNNITANCAQMDVPFPTRPIVETTTESFQDVVPSVLPFFHIYGFSVLLASKLASGCKIITLSRFDPESFIKTLVAHRSSLVFMVPPIINFLTNHPSVKAEHLSMFRTAFSGAAPISQGEVERFMAKVNRPEAEFVQAYGLSESSPVLLTNLKGSKKYGSTGGPIPNTRAKIIDPNDPLQRGLPAEQQGELLVQGPQVMMGYLNNEEDTKATITSGGWLRTGDVASYDSKGYFYLTDRLKELIKVKGFQVAPAELEAVIGTHKEVADAAVIGIPDEISGEVPLAFVVRKPGSNLTESDLQSYVAGQVAPFKRLSGGVRFVEAVPRNATGKILRVQLKEML